MALIHAAAERMVRGNPENVYALVADYREGRPRILPPAFLDYVVEEGGAGVGTVVRYRLRAGRRERQYRMRVDEARIGADDGALTETDTSSSFATSWALKAAEGGRRTAVQISSRWEGTGGVGGFFERLFAPTALRRLHVETLDRLASEMAAGTSPGPSR
jgi:hypothetical protein